MLRPSATGAFLRAGRNEYPYDIDAQVWLADVLAYIADTPSTRLEDLLPWNWQTTAPLKDQAA